MPRHPPEAKALARALYVQGLKYYAISIHTQVKESVIRSWAKRGNWGSLVANPLQNIPVVMQRGVAVETANGLQARGDKIRDKLSQELAAQVDLLASQPPATVAELGNSKHGQGRASIAKAIAETAGLVHDWGNQGQAGLVMIGELSREPEPEPPAVDIAATIAAEAPEAPPAPGDTTMGSVPADTGTLSEPK